jgi:hypothetical protein
MTRSNESRGGALSSPSRHNVVQSSAEKSASRSSSQKRDAARETANLSFAGEPGKGGVYRRA